MKKLKKQKSLKFAAYSMTEILIVLAIIGILLLMVLPSQTSVVGQAKSIEAQSMLNHVYGLQKSHFFRFSKYASDLNSIGFESQITVDQGGQAVYKIQITEATTNGFKATATAVSDFDGDGNFNTWQINEQKNLVEVIKD